MYLLRLSVFLQASISMLLTQCEQSTQKNEVLSRLMYPEKWS